MSDRSEAKKAHAKLRHEVREAVTARLMNEGFIDRADLRGLVEGAIEKSVESALDSERLRKAIDRLLMKEIEAALGGIKGLREIVRRKVDSLSSEMAKEFLDKNVRLSIREGSDW